MIRPAVNVFKKLDFPKIKKSKNFFLMPKSAQKCKTINALFKHKELKITLKLPIFLVTVKLKI